VDVVQDKWSALLYHTAQSSVWNNWYILLLGLPEPSNYSLWPRSKTSVLCSIARNGGRGFHWFCNRFLGCSTSPLELPRLYIVWCDKGYSLPHSMVQYIIWKAEEHADFSSIL